MRLKSPTFDPATSTGLSSRTSALLAYSGWWVTGLTIWWIERRDLTARYHAAQSMVLFGGGSVLVAVLGALAAASLSFMPGMFQTLVGATGATVGAGLLMWLLLLWRTMRGDDWRVAGIRRAAARLAGVAPEDGGS